MSKAEKERGNDVERMVALTLTQCKGEKDEDKLFSAQKGSKKNRRRHFSAGTKKTEKEKSRFLNLLLH